MSPAPTISGLHKLALACGFPRGYVHEILHEAAEAYGASSLTDLTAEQRSHLARWIRKYGPPASCRQGRYGPPASCRQAGSKRKRSGRRPRSGVLIMMTPAQRDLINAIASELGWTNSLLNRMLQNHFELANLDAVGTSAQATKVITMLKSYKWSQRRPRRSAASAN